MVTLRNRAVNELTKLYDSVNRIADNIAGISGFIALILTIVKVAQTAISALGLAQIIAPIIPNPALVKINAATELAQSIIDKVRYKADGDAARLDADSYTKGNIYVYKNPDGNEELVLAGKLPGGTPHLFKVEKNDSGKWGWINDSQEPPMWEDFKDY